MPTARDIMTADPVSVTEQTGVQEVAQILLESHHHGVPVVDADNRLVGLVSDSDLVDSTKRIHLPTMITILDTLIPIGGFKQYAEDLRKATATTAGDLCTRGVDYVLPDADVDDVATLLSEHHIHLVPVLDADERLLGVITNTDIIRVLSQRT
ncbi:MAG TPA: CBS domain-containing protein [Gammaproteobacteria bacterium]|nr:CBS domain-containing protein [Gammaproteobacteria bacterium]